MSAPSLVITRHPFERLASAYFDKMFGHEFLKERELIVRQFPSKAAKRHLLNLLPEFSSKTPGSSEIPT